MAIERRGALYRTIILILVVAGSSTMELWSADLEGFSGDWRGEMTVDGREARISIRIVVDSTGVSQYFPTDKGGWERVDPDVAGYDRDGENLVYYWINTGGIWSETQVFSLTRLDRNRLSVRWMRHVNNRAPGSDGEDWHLAGGGVLVRQARVWFESDLSSDPSLRTNNPESYRIRQDGTFFIRQRNIDRGGEYGYFPTSYSGGSFRLEWDVKMLSCDYACGVHFGLFDGDMNSTDAGSYLYMVFTQEDRGRQMLLASMDMRDRNASDWRAGRNYEFDTWYRVRLVYDEAARTISSTVVDKRSGIVVDENLITGAGPFDAGMNRLGGSNVRRGAFQVPGATAQALVDNIVFGLLR